MKSLTLVLTMFLSIQSFAFEVICSCEEPCQQVLFDVDESSPAVLMTMTSEVKEIQGAAIVTTSKLKDQVVYKLGNLVLIREGNNFRMLGSERVCSLVVLPR